MRIYAYNLAVKEKGCGTLLCDVTYFALDFTYPFSAMD